MSTEIRHFEDFALDWNSCCLSRNGAIVRLERIPLELLSLLVERPNQIVTRAEILERIWGPGVFIDSENAINTAVRKIRRALNDDANTPRFIVTIPGKGYRFIAPVLVPSYELKPSGANNGELQRYENGAQPVIGKSVDCPQPPVAPEENQSHFRYGLADLLSIAGLALIVSVVLAILQLSQRVPAPSGSKLSAEHRPPPLPNKPSIAVLPFINLSGDHEQQYFSDGITNDLITGLSRLPAFLVIARASTFTYKDKAPKLQNIGRELGVRYVLEGSVRKTAERVRVTVQLADTVNGAEVWAEQYDRPMRDVFALQDEIVRRILTTLNLQIAVLQRGALIPRSTENLEAYDDLLRGTWHLLSLTGDGNAQARRMLEKAIELDSKYALAFALLGSNYHLGWALSFSPDPDALDRGLQLAQRAAALDDSLAVAHSVLAQIYLAKKQEEQALTEAQRCITLDPNAAFGYSVLGAVRAIQGTPPEAIATIEKAMRLDPRNAINYLWVEGWAYTFLAQWNDAIAALKVYLERFPNLAWPHAWLAIAYSGQGDDDAARAETNKVERLIALKPSADGYSALASEFYARGMPSEGLAAAENGIRLDAHDRGLLFQRASAYTSLGRWDESLSALESYIALYPRDIYAHAYLAHDYSVLGQIAAARKEAAEVEREFTLEANFDTYAPRGYDVLAEVMNDTGRPMEALAAADKANRPGRVKGIYLYERGRAYTQLGRWQEGISALRRHLAVHPGEVWPHVDLAVDYFQLGQDDAAQVEVAEILRLNPQFSLKMGLAGELPEYRELAAYLVN